MPLKLHIEPGGEKYLSFAKTKLAQMKDWMLRAKLGNFTKHILVSTGERIMLNSLAPGHGITMDFIRITAKIAGGVSVLLDAALIPGIDPALLDSGHSDFGLVLPKDTLKLPGSFKTGTLDPARTPAYLGMIANHAFAAQHPTEYADVETYLTPEATNLQPGVFRYFPEVAGGTALIVHEIATNPTWASLTWLSGMNANAGANLDVRLALIEPFDVVGSYFYGYASVYSSGADGVFGVAQAQTLLSGSFPSTVRLILYRRDVAPQTLIETSGSAETNAVGIPLRSGNEHYLASSFSESLGPSAVVTLKSTASIVFTDTFSNLANALGGRVAPNGFLVAYELANGAAWDIYARSHLGTELVLSGTAGSSQHRESSFAISALGVPAVAAWRLVGASENAYVKIWGTPLVELGTGRPACAWSTDDKYLFVVLGATLRVFSAAGTLLHTEAAAFSPVGSAFCAGFFVTGSHKLTALWKTRAQEVQVTIVEDPDSGAFVSATVGSVVNLVPLDAGVVPYQWGIDHTDRFV